MLVDITTAADTKAAQASLQQQDVVKNRYKEKLGYFSSYPNALCGATRIAHPHLRISNSIILKISKLLNVATS